MTWVWVALVVVAMMIALDKAMLPGAAILGIGFLAQLIPAKEATGITLAMCILGDWMTIWAYRRDVDWKTLGRLLPNVVIGVVLGAGFLFLADDAVTRRVIGAIILVFVSWNLVVMLNKRRSRVPGRLVVSPSSQVVAAGAEGVREVIGASAEGEQSSAVSVASRSGRGEDAVAGPQGPDAVASARQAGEAAAPTSATRLKRSVFGSLAGFTTMVANAGGPVTSMYFMTEGFPVRLFLGTGAWFYLVLNLVKLPFSIGLGMLTTKYLVPLLIAIPFMIATVALGRWVSGRINKAVFNALVIVLTLVTAVTLLICPVTAVTLLV